MGKDLFHKSLKNYNTRRGIAVVFSWVTLLIMTTSTALAQAGPNCQWQGQDGVMTGLGCIPVTPGGLVSWGLRFVIGIAGGIALLLLLFGGIKYITSRGDPKALQEASETITSALAGFLLIILSVLILRIIGYDILQLPGWKDIGGKLQLPE